MEERVKQSNLFYSFMSKWSKLRIYVLPLIRALACALEKGGSKAVLSQSYGDISLWFSLNKLSACMISDLVEPITINIYNFHKVLWLWNAIITTFLHLKTFMVSLQYLVCGCGSARVAQWPLLHGNLLMSWVSHFFALRYLTSLMCWQYFFEAKLL